MAFPKSFFFIKKTSSKLPDTSPTHKTILFPQCRIKGAGTSTRNPSSKHNRLIVTFFRYTDKNLMKILNICLLYYVPLVSIVLTRFRHYCESCQHLLHHRNYLLSRRNELINPRQRVLQANHHSSAFQLCGDLVRFQGNIPQRVLIPC